LLSGKNHDHYKAHAWVDRLKIVREVVDGASKPGRAADRLGLIERQIRRLAQRYGRQVFAVWYRDAAIFRAIIVLAKKSRGVRCIRKIYPIENLQNEKSYTEA
jgi:hypothetical protein